MLNMSTMSYIKLSITVFQEQQNGETNTLGLLTTFRHCWVICGGSWPKSFSSLILTSDMQDSLGVSLGVSCLLSRSRATLTPGHPGHALPCPSLQALHDCCCKHSTHQLPTLTLLPQVEDRLWLCSSALIIFFFLKNHLSCYTTRQESLRLW